MSEFIFPSIWPGGHPRRPVPEAPPSPEQLSFAAVTETARPGEFGRTDWTLNTAIHGPPDGCPGVLNPRPKAGILGNGEPTLSGPPGSRIPVALLMRRDS